MKKLARKIRALAVTACVALPLGVLGAEDPITVPTPPDLGSFATSATTIYAAAVGVCLLALAAAIVIRYARKGFGGRG
jgi:hypothetical protein